MKMTVIVKKKHEDDCHCKKKKHEDDWYRKKKHE